MTKFIAFSLFLFCCITFQLSAQTNRKVSGAVIDTAKKAIANAKIQLIADKDTLNTETAEDGTFSISKIKATQFSIQISLLGYHTLTAQHTFAEKEKHKTLNTFELKMSSQMLQEVVINSKPNPIRFMQDTVEYNAAAFNVNEGDNVSDLLKQFPGIEVDDNYNTTTMGKEMTKLRVNGQDFFTSDVKDFISRLPAAIVSKIQVIDDFGDQANFTGIKMGEPKKMMNIVTKSGMNNGSFGSASANAGTNDMIGSQVHFNLWKESKQRSANVNINTSDNGAGISRSLGIGLSYNDKVGKNGTSGINYNFQNLSNAFLREQMTESINQGGNYINNARNEGNHAGNNHNINWTLNYNNKKTFVYGGINGSYNNSINQQISMNRQSGVLRQDLNNHNKSKGLSPSINGSLTLSKKLNNKKNSFSINTFFSMSGSNTDQNISSNTLYYDNDTQALLKDSLLNRDLSSKTKGENFTLGANYSIGLNKTSDTTGRKSLNFSYTGGASRSINEVSTFVYDNKSNQVSFVDSLSTSFSTLSFIQSLGANYNFEGKKIRYNLGFKASPNMVTNRDLRLVQTTKQNTLNYSPNLNFSKSFTQGKTLSINYYSANTNPSIYQLQPIRNAQSLQNIVVGNPDLKSSFHHNLDANFNYAHVKSGRNIRVGFNASTTQREIVDHIILIPDTLNSLKQITKYENVNGNYQVNGNYSVHVPIKKNKFSIRYSGALGISNRAIIFNNQRAFGKGLNFSQQLGSTVSFKKMNFDTHINYSITTNNNMNSLYRSGEYPMVGIGQVLSADFFRTKSFGAGANGNLRLKQLMMNAGVNYNTSHSDAESSQAVPDVSSINMNLSGQLTVKKAYFVTMNASKRRNYGYTLANTDPLLINLGIGKSFLKDKSLKLSINANDLLNQNNNISRAVAGNTIIETRNQQQTRVFLMNLSYNISKFGGKNVRVDAD